MYTEHIVIQCIYSKSTCLAIHNFSDKFYNASTENTQCQQLLDIKKHLIVFSTMVFYL